MSDAFPCLMGSQYHVQSAPLTLSALLDHLLAIMAPILRQMSLLVQHYLL